MSNSTDRIYTNMPANLITFLCGHGALNKYLRNLLIDTSEQLLWTHCSPSDMDTLDWRKSPEGFEYWNDLDDIWKCR